MKVLAKVLLGFGLMLTVAFLWAGGKTSSIFAPAEVPEGKAVVYFFRPAQLLLSARTIFMAFPNSDKSYSMVNGGYYPVIVDPGEITVAGVGTNLKPTYFTINAEAGVEKYVQVTFAKTLDLLVPAAFEELSPDQAAKAIQRCKLIDVTK